MQSVGVPIDSTTALVRLWGHEVLRVFHDRLIADDDRALFCRMLANIVEDKLKQDFRLTFPPPAKSAAIAADTPAAVRAVLYPLHCHFDTISAVCCMYTL
jgi:dynein heavy chain